MKLIKNLLLTCFLAVPAVLSAEVNSWLTFRMLDNTEISVPSDNLKIDYSNRVLHISPHTVNEEISIEKVRSMQFTSSPAKISEILNDNQSGEKEFFDISGKKIGSFISFDEARKTLPSGIYIIKSGEKSLKVII